MTYWKMKKIGKINQQLTEILFDLKTIEWHEGDLEEAIQQIKQLFNYEEEDKPLEERRLAFIEDIGRFKSEYSPDLMNSFFRYWAEADKRGKMRWEKQKTWDTKLRLVTWAKNDSFYKITKFLNKGNQQLSR